MKTLLVAPAWLLFLCSFAFSQSRELNIVPQPKSVARSSGEFKFGSKTRIAARDESGKRAAEILNDLLSKNFGFKLQYAASDAKTENNIVEFSPASGASANNLSGAYVLKVTPQNVRISGDEAGQFYAVQTLMQMLPAEFKGAAKIPAAEITDQPRFGYRGMHLDVSRHFMPIEFVKKYIDLMAQYKFNRFHWHLTDDQGWRIEIKKYPRLTEIGSRRSETVVGRNLQPYVGDGIPVEGFYTQEQIKDVVAYAKARFITVIPEIELPGHSSAALAAYPNLGCRENYQYKVQTTWGIFKEVYCPSETTFQFLEDVLRETIDLFPDSPYIHIGGDEVLKDFWKDSPLVKELEAKENLKDEHEVQSYFIRRMEKFINSKGKKVIGWDEILEGGLAPNATVMSWRGMKGGIEAARSHHEVIMTPSEFVYFDYGQGDPKFEPVNIGNFVPLEKVYSFEPVPKDLSDAEKKYILGGQANVWTEYLKTPDKVEYMVFPRMLALAEVLWSPPENKNFADFQKRLANQFARLDKQNVNYRIPEPNGLRNVLLTGAKDSAEINLNSLLPNGKIYYTTDGSEPATSSGVYKKPFKLALKPNEKIELRTIVVNDKGRKSVPYQAVIWRREPLAAVAEPTEKKAGALVSFYKDSFVSVNDLGKATATFSGETKTLNLNQFREKIADKQPFGASFDAYLFVPKDEIYAFELESLGGVDLWIDDEKIIDADGLNPKQTKTGIVPLKQGFHRIRLSYIKGAGDYAFGLRWAINGQGMQRIYGGELFH